MIVLFPEKVVEPKVAFEQTIFYSVGNDNRILIIDFLEKTNTFFSLVKKAV